MTPVHARRTVAPVSPEHQTGRTRERDRERESVCVYAGVRLERKKKVVPEQLFAYIL